MTHFATSIGLIVNPTAGRTHRKYMANDRFWERHLPDAAVFVTQTLADLDAAVRQLTTCKTPVIACLGGDGTLFHTINAVLRHSPRDDLPTLLPLAGGTLNGLAKALGTGGTPEEMLRRALLPHTGALQLQLLQIEDAAGRTCHYGFTLGAGLATRAARRYYAAPQPGVRAALRVAGTAAFSAVSGGAFYSPSALEVTVDADAPLSGVHTVVAGVVDQPFLWIRPFGALRPREGTFRFATAGMSPMTTATHLWSLTRGTCKHPRSGKGHARNLRLLGNEGYVIDGEVFSSSGKFSIIIKPGPIFKFLNMRFSDEHE